MINFKSIRYFIPFITLLFIIVSHNLCFGHVFIVNNTNGEGSGSLKECIIKANNLEGLDTIQFNISGKAPYSIMLSSSLPVINDPIYIDGFVQNKSSDEHNRIELTLEYDVINVIDGLSLAKGADHSTIRGLVINNFTGYGITITSCNYVSIEGNFIGTNLEGNEAHGNFMGGILVRNGCNNVVIGGKNDTEGNLISGNNNNGIIIKSNCREVEIDGNIIGLNKSGSREVANIGDGIYIEKSKNIDIGVKAANTISGNIKSGISVAGISENIFIKNNFIGTDITGNKPLGNNENGIFLTQASSVLIGGNSKNSRNVISGNKKSGISLSFSSENNVIQGNFIGICTDSSSAGNRENGIFVGNTKDVVIGGESSLTGNIISNNGQSGVVLYNESDGSKIQGNIIGLYSNEFSESNKENGIYIENSKDVLIGGNSSELGNIISNNSRSGIVLFSGSDRVKIQGNIIGLGKDAITPSGNLENGIYVEKSEDVIIGGGEESLKNIIADNHNGIQLSINSFKCLIQGNYIGVSSDLTSVPNKRAGIQIDNTKDIKVSDNIFNISINEQIIHSSVKGLSMNKNFVGLFYTIIYLFVILCGFIFIAHKKDTFTYNIVYVIAIILSILGLNGVIFDMFWPMWLNHKLSISIIGLSIIISVFISDRILNIKKQSIINLKLFYSSLILGLLYISSIVFGNTISEIILASVTILSILALVVIPFKKLLSKSNSSRFYYLIAIAVMLFEATIQHLINMGVIPYSVSLLNILQISSFTGIVLLLSIGLGYQINILKNENKQVRKQLEEYLKLLDVQKLRKINELALNKAEGNEESKSVSDTENIINEATSDLFTPLSERELDVLSLIAQGKSNKKIAEELFISINTVKSHIVRIYEKLEVNNRIQAVSKAVSLNLFNKE